MRFGSFKFSWLVSLALASVLALSACSARKGGGGEDGRTTTEDGGQHGGGGHVLLSSSEEVHAAIAQALDTAKEEQLFYNPLYVFMHLIQAKLSVAQRKAIVNTPDPDLNDQSLAAIPVDSMGVYRGSQNQDNDNKVFKIIYRILNGADLKCSGYFMQEQVAVGCPPLKDGFSLNDDELTKLDPYNQHLIQTLAQSPIEIKETGDCGAAAFDHAAASVSDFRPGATICLSVENLRRIPKNDLLPQVLALLFHEAAHLHGYGEHVAQTLQKMFWDRYTGVIDVTASENFTEVAKSRLHSAQIYLDQLCKDPKTKISENLFQSLFSGVATEIREITILRADARYGGMQYEPVGRRLSLVVRERGSFFAYANGMESFSRDYLPYAYGVTFDAKYYQKLMTKTYSRPRAELCAELNRRVSRLLTNLLNTEAGDPNGGFCYERNMRGTDVTPDAPHCNVYGMFAPELED